MYVFESVCVCMCVFLYVLHIEYQNIYSTSKVRIV